MTELDGIVLLLAKIKFAGKEIGLISEDGVQWGGDAPEYASVVAAQTRSVVKKVLKKAGTIEMRFKLIELKVQNLVDTLGGEADATVPGKWNAPAIQVIKEGAIEIETVTGQVITAERASLVGELPTGDLGSDSPMGFDVVVTVLSDGKTSPFSIDNSVPLVG